ACRSCANRVPAGLRSLARAPRKNPPRLRGGPIRLGHATDLETAAVGQGPDVAMAPALGELLSGVVGAHPVDAVPAPLGAEAVVPGIAVDPGGDAGRRRAAADHRGVGDLAGGVTVAHA